MHGLSCCFSKGRHTRHAAINDILKRSLDSAKIPSLLDPVDLYRRDGKRPDGANTSTMEGGESASLGCNLSRYTCTFAHLVGS